MDIISLPPEEGGGEKDLIYLVPIAFSCQRKDHENVETPIERREKEKLIKSEIFLFFQCPEIPPLLFYACLFVCHCQIRKKKVGLVALFFCGFCPVLAKAAGAASPQKEE